jgi:hypothetical protein
MNAKHIPIEEIRSTLDRLRQDPSTQRKFPRELWGSIIQLTKVYPIEEVCRQLRIDPIYLQHKMDQSQEQALEFREIVTPATPSVSDRVTIELSSSTTGLRARIQGPLSCLNCLHKLFER